MSGKIMSRITPKVCINVLEVFIKLSWYVGWIARDHEDWVRSNQMIHMLARRTNAKLVFGHDREIFFSYKHAPEFYL